MGGSGSGRWRVQPKKYAVEDGLKLTVSNLKQKLNFTLDAGDESFARGHIRWGSRREVTDTIAYKIENRRDQLLVHLTYTTIGRWENTKTDNDYAVHVTYNMPPFGGRRWWWICPLVGNGRACKRRVSKLYLPPGSNYFGCRHCHELTYRSCQESHIYDCAFKDLAAAMYIEGLRSFINKDVKSLLEQGLSDSLRWPK
jgi:hypothetical protein